MHRMLDSLQLFLFFTVNTRFRHVSRATEFCVPNESVPNESVPNDGVPIILRQS